MIGRLGRAMVVVAFTAGCGNVWGAEPYDEIDLEYGARVAKTVTVNGTELKYLDKGIGPPVVLVHGALSDFRSWKPFIEEASKRYRVLAYSRRHFFPNPSSRELPRLDEPMRDVADLIAFIEALDLDPVHLVGHSAGGHTALVAAVNRPDLLRSLVLAEGGFLQAPGVDNPGAIASRSGRILLEAGREEEAVRTFIDATSGPGSFAAMSEANRRAILDNRMTLGLPLAPPPSCAAIGGIPVPTLLVEGDSSLPFLHDVVESVSACLPAAGRVIIPNAGHDMFRDNPDAFNAAVLKLLDANDR